MADNDLTTVWAVQTALLRPLTPNESTYVPDLIAQASTKLRGKTPIDDRIAAYQAGGRVPPAVDPEVVASMLADVIKRVLVNPKGLWSRSETTGPFSESETYFGARAGGQADRSLGALAITDDDLKQLLPGSSTRPGSIQVKAALASHDLRRRVDDRPGYIVDTCVE